MKISRKKEKNQEWEKKRKKKEGKDSGRNYAISGRRTKTKRHH